jgi:Kazal-type serine protease inhibitor domain
MREEFMAKFFAICVALAFAVLMGLPGTAGAAHVGEKCQIPGDSCGPALWCEPPTDTCFLFNATGHCVRVPKGCPSQIVRPVCGCNGQTYGNDCQRLQAKEAKKHNGKCL